MANGGQVYVKVQADTSTYVARNVGSGGSTTVSYTITWSFNGGISGYHGWNSPKGLIKYVEGDVDATNAAVAAAYQEATLYDLIDIVDCVQRS